jgi:hypothetical protein
VWNYASEGGNGLIGTMDKHMIVTLMNQGRSLREVSRITGIGRKTVTRYWRNYPQQISLLGSGDDVRTTQERITSSPAYDTSSRRPVKYTDEIDAAIDEILSGEAEKTRILKDARKQHLTCRQFERSSGPFSIDKYSSTK